jgi:hypothetical protein
MSKVYQHKPRARDKYLGKVSSRGKVYKARFLRNKYIGRLDVASGRIYQARLGPDKYIGRVNLQDGKVYLARFGPDQYLGQVSKDGKFFLHKRLARDEYLGRITKMASYGHGGAAYLLLVLPALKEEVDPQLLDEGESEGDQSVREANSANG